MSHLNRSLINLWVVPLFMYNRLHKKLYILNIYITCIMSTSDSSTSSYNILYVWVVSQMSHPELYPLLPWVPTSNLCKAQTPVRQTTARQNLWYPLVMSLTLKIYRSKFKVKINVNVYLLITNYSISWYLATLKLLNDEKLVNY